MKITAQEEYGLRCLLQLARNKGEARPVTVREIARKEGLSLAYAEKLMRVLSAAGLAESIRGARGGFRLRAEPREITVADAVRALGGFASQQQICNRYTGTHEACVHIGDCTIRPLWGMVNQELERVLGGVSLSTLLESETQSVTELNPSEKLVPLTAIELGGGKQ